MQSVCREVVNSSYSDASSSILDTKSDEYDMLHVMLLYLMICFIDIVDASQILL